MDGEGMSMVLIPVTCGSIPRGVGVLRVRHLNEDETEFLSPYGVRALSRVHETVPDIYRHDGMDLSVGYRPAESGGGQFGANSNWRGLIWMPREFPSHRVAAEVPSLLR